MPQGNRMKLLFVTARFPYPPYNGDSHRAYHQIKRLSRDHEIVLFSLSDKLVSEEAYSHVSQFCERIEIAYLSRWRALWNMAAGFATRSAIQVRYFNIPDAASRLQALLQQGQLDLIHATLIRVTPYVWNTDGIPVVVDAIDSLGLSLGTRRRQIHGLKRLAYEVEYRRVRDFEKAVARKFPALIVISEQDREALGGDRVYVVPNGVDTEQYAYTGIEERDASTLIFTGNMAYDSNERAVMWFANQVWPIVRAACSDARLQIVGVGPGKRVRALARPGTGIEVLGMVSDIISYLQRATIAICPMQAGSGMLNKVLEALAVGVPIVATSTANAGVGAVHGRDLLVADNAADFADAILKLLNDREKRDHLATSGRAYVEGRFSWDQHIGKLQSVYSRVLSASLVGGFKEC
jgi:polysaccharide biosynthesis protein PslH